jgi:hypothetical protein
MISWCNSISISIIPYSWLKSTKDGYRLLLNFCQSIINVGEEVVQEQGQDLGDLLSRAIESKIGVEGIIRRLENLP